ncbi:MAG: VWA domain-containing protein [Clostridia bacterium]|nr:VWA domain-containing protein [Clostridia bacterium]
MTLLTPLGLLGLIAIVLLIIIYIIRPNFQQKMVSTTFVWKLSLKYRKKRIPVSKIRNILLILCQVLILASCAWILAQPVTEEKTATNDGEVIAVIDSSASMRADTEGETRFIRAVNQVIDLSKSTYEKGGVMSVIIADEEPYFLAQRVPAEDRSTLSAALDALLADEKSCSYGVSDMETAMSLCETLINENPKAQVYLYTDTTYDYISEKIKKPTVCLQDLEWNAAVLDARVELQDGYYTFFVNIACYGPNMDLLLTVDIDNANPEYTTGEGRAITYEEVITCNNGQTMQVVFINSLIYQPSLEEDPNTIFIPLEMDELVYSYNEISFSVKDAQTGESLEDSIQRDNKFYIYGGQKEKIRVQYVSALPNPFFSNILLVLQDHYSEYWDMEIVEVKKGQQPEMTGFDFYIFEHTMPSMMPNDGVVFLVDPQGMPTGSGMRLEQSVIFRETDRTLIEEDSDHPMMKYVTAEDITVSKYTRAVFDTAYDYEVLMSMDEYPVFVAKNTPQSKVAIMLFDLHYSNLAILKDFPILVHNMFQYFLPPVVQKNVFDIGESMMVNTRTDSIEVCAPTGETLTTFTEFPATMTPFDEPGTYTLKQGEFFEKATLDEKIYVKLPAEECNIWAHKETLRNPYTQEVEEKSYKDWLIYLAAALVALLFIEWWLQSHDTM